MSITIHDSEVLHFDKKFGFITPSRVILTNGSDKRDTIAFDAIEKVNLIKYRVLYTNFALLAMSLSIMIGSVLFWNPEQMIYLLLPISGVCLLVYSITHKFYYYRLVIMEKNMSLHTIKVSQFDRKYIKGFYYSIVKNNMKNVRGQMAI